MQSSVLTSSAPCGDLGTLGVSEGRPKALGWTDAEGRERQTHPQMAGPGGGKKPAADVDASGCKYRREFQSNYYLDHSSEL